MKKRKLSKPSKNIILALVESPKSTIISIVTTLVIISGSSTVFQKITWNNPGMVTEEEIIEQEKLINKDYYNENNNFLSTIGYICEGTIVLTAFSSAALMINKKLKKPTTNNYRLIIKREKNSVIGSKINRSFRTYR